MGGRFSRSERICAGDDETHRDRPSISNENIRATIQRAEEFTLDVRAKSYSTSNESALSRFASSEWELGILYSRKFLVCTSRPSEEAFWRVIGVQTRRRHGGFGASGQIRREARQRGAKTYRARGSDRLISGSAAAADADAYAFACVT